MRKVLVSHNGELVRHFAAPPLQRLGLQLLVARDSEDTLAQFRNERPQVVVLAARRDGLALARQCRAHDPAARLIVVATHPLEPDHVRDIALSRCDQLLVAPLSADELHDVIALQLGQPRPGTETFAITLQHAGKPLAATVSNLSVDGLRAVVAEPMAEGQSLDIAIATTDKPAVSIRGSVVWAQSRDEQTVLGIAFAELPPAGKSLLAKLTQWQIASDGERTRVVLRGDFTEATRFDDLLPAMVGRVLFDMAQVTYMNSLGVRAWCEFLRQARIQGYELHACSTAFVLRATLVRELLGRGTVTTFFAPYHCIGCDHEEERLLQAAAILAANLEPPAFGCPRCGSSLELDDVPERYFAFLHAEPI